MTAAAPAHGFLTPAGPLAIGERVEVVCDEGYASVGNGTVACVAPGVLVGEARCEPAECPAYPAPAHGSVEPGGAVRYGDEVEVRCDEGYRLVGEERAVCGPDGSYSEVVADSDRSN